MNLDPINAPENSEDDETRFPCACGDPACRGWDEDQNIRIGKAWYAADCVMANHHPLVVEARERDAKNAERANK